MVEEPISIAHLKFFAADRDLEENTFVPEVAPESGKKVAVIGGGPAGMMTAGMAASMGANVCLATSLLLWLSQDCCFSVCSVFYLFYIEVVDI